VTQWVRKYKLSSICYCSPVGKILLVRNLRVIHLENLVSHVRRFIICCCIVTVIVINHGKCNWNLCTVECRQWSVRHV